MGAQFGSRASETRNKVNLNVIGKKKEGGKTLAEWKRQRGEEERSKLVKV